MRFELTLAFLLREWLLPIERPERDSPCLLVKGTDCAGDVQRVAVVIVRSLPVLEGPVPCWCRVASVGTVCPTYLPRALFSCAPRANRAGVGVASGATKLVPAILSGLAQCRKQCPLTIRAKVLHVLRRFLRLPLAPPGIDENAGRPVDVDGIFIQRIE